MRPVRGKVAASLRCVADGAGRARISPVAMAKCQHAEAVIYVFAWCSPSASLGLLIAAHSLFPARIESSFQFVLRQEELAPRTTVPLLADDQGACPTADNADTVRRCVEPSAMRTSRCRIFSPLEIVSDLDRSIIGHRLQTAVAIALPTLARQHSQANCGGSEPKNIS